MAHNPHEYADVHGEQREERRRYQQHLQDLSRLMDMPEGKRVLWRIMEKTRLHRTTHVPNDPEASNILVGQRNIGLWLQSDIMAACPQRYLELMVSRLSGAQSNGDEHGGR